MTCLTLNGKRSPARSPTLRALPLGRNAALAVFLFCCATLPLAAQRSPAIDERFREASDAMRKGSLEDAGEGFAAVAKAAPDFAEAHLNLGLVREDQGRHEEAVASLKRALALKPRLHGANLFLGIAYFHLNRPDLAAASLERETSAYPKDPTAWMWLGVVRLGQDKPEEAAEALDRAAKLAPD